MAGGRRFPGGRATSARMQVGTSNNVSSSNTGINSGVSNVDERRNPNEPISIGRTLAPKHVPIPTIPVDGQLTFEAMSLVMSLVAASLQLLNLYRSVWWLPEFHNEYSVNFYLIDSYLLIFIVTMIARQFVYALLCKFLDIVTPLRWLDLAQRVMRILLLLVIMCIIFWCLYHMSEKHNVIKIFYLCYPISIYFLMFGTSIIPFFDICSDPANLKEDRKTKFSLDKPLHNCSLSAPAIRAEVATLKSDFNHRLKRALFASSGSTYLCGVAPLIFVPQHLHFDVYWVLSCVILIWVGRFGAYFTQAYPVRYCDVLHRAALHLGKWSKVASKNSHIPIPPWNETILWPHGSLVKHNKEFYRSEGICTAAEPGNSSHYRFYTFFHNPTIWQSPLMGFAGTLISIQLLILLQSTEWYRILSISLLNMMTFHTVYKLLRDYLVCMKVYRAEQLVQEKAQTALSNNSQ